MALWSKVKNRKRMNSKALSSIVGAIFMMLIIGSLASAYFFFTLSQNTVYNDAVRAKNQFDLERMSEAAQASDTRFAVESNGVVTITARIRNTGASSVQLVTLWVQANEASSGWTDRNFTKNFDITLQSGEETLQTFQVPISGLLTTQTYSFASWFITSKGNTVSLPKPAGSIVVAQVAQGIGSIALDFANFKYFTYTTTTKLANFPTGIKSFNVPGDATPIAFGVSLTNLDPREKTITLNQYSNIWIVFPGSPGQTAIFHIVNVASDGTVSSYASQQTIAYGETKFMVFASSKDSSFTQSSVSPPLTPNAGAVNLLLLGSIGTENYGQNIPFVSVYIHDVV